MRRRGSRLRKTALQPDAKFNFAETSGTQITDITGNGKHGVYFNNPILDQAGRNGGKSVKLTSTGGHLRFIGDVFSAGLSPGTDAAWRFY